jgi:hypothetical protein
LVLEDCVLYKSEQRANDEDNWQAEYELD